MRVNTYQIDHVSSAYLQSSKYLTVPAGTDMGAVRSKIDADVDLRALKPFQMDYELSPTDHRLGFNSAESCQHVITNGYALHQAETRVTINNGAP